MATSKYLLLLPVLLIFSFACEDSSTTTYQVEQVVEDQTPLARLAMQTHLDAISSRDLETLRATLDPGGDMQLILPGSEIMYTADSFMEYHEAWFQDTNWTFDTKILSLEAGPEMAMAVTEVVYREPERDGRPYFNRMIVSYDLKNKNGKWYVIKDHASSVEKSTDVE